MYKYASLTPEIIYILKEKDTEAAFSGKYCNEINDGNYLCRGCGAVLFRPNSHSLLQFAKPGKVTTLFVPTYLTLGNTSNGHFISKNKKHRLPF